MTIKIVCIRVIKILSVLFLEILPIASMGQINPIRWSCQATKQSDSIFELRVTAKIDEPWHIYAPDLNENIGVPTTIYIYPNPLFSICGKISYNVDPIVEKAEGTELKYFEGNVTFIQKIRVKGYTEFTLNGMIEYMCCANGHCLAPAKKRFSVSIDNTKKNI